MNTGAFENALNNEYRRYARWLIIPVFSLVIVTAIGSYFFQPYWGPLTRVGGFSENEYGWNAPQEEFERPLFTNAISLNEYDHYYDVVVVGDSFSEDERKGWQNYFVKDTGLSVITLQHKIGVEKVIASEVFRSNPPRYFVFESLEQFSLPRLEQLSSLTPLTQVSAASKNNDGKASLSSPSLFKTQTHLVLRDETPPLGEMRMPNMETRIGESFHFIKKTITRSISTAQTAEYLRSLWGSNRETTSFELLLKKNASSLFSSKQTAKILVYSLDIGKITADSYVRLAAQGAWQMRRAVEANGKTKVLMMIFPDKLSVYAPYLRDPSVAPPSIIPRMAHLYPDQIRLDTTFTKAVAAGVQDLYLPDDSHCGYKGYELAAGQLKVAIKDSVVQPITMVSK